LAENVARVTSMPDVTGQASGWVQLLAVAAVIDDDGDRMMRSALWDSAGEVN